MKRMLVIGAGGIGTYFLALVHDKYEITIMDDDIYEARNRARQALRGEGPKAIYLANLYGCEAIPARIKDHNGPVLKAQFTPRIRRALGIEEEWAAINLDNFDIVALCVDNDAARREVYLAYRETEKTLFLNMANGEGDKIIITIMAERGIQKPTLGEMHPDMIDPGNVDPEEAIGCARRMEEGNAPQQLAIANAMAAYFGFQVLKEVEEKNKFLLYGWFNEVEDADKFQRFFVEVN